MPGGYLTGDPAITDMMASAIPGERRRLFGPQSTPEGVAPLMPCTDAVSALYGPIMWADRAGLNSDAQITLAPDREVDLVPTSWVTSFYVPVAPADGYGPRRWPGANPAQMVWPWMWLPPRLARPQVVDDGSSGLLVEPTDVWQTRVALELGAAGLVHPRLGWVDVLAEMAGVDVDDPADFQRVREWMDGGADSQLDELGDSFADQFLPVDASDPDWAVDEATLIAHIPLDGDTRGPLVVAGAAAGATGLLALLDDPGLSVADARVVAGLGPLIPCQSDDSLRAWRDIADAMGGTGDADTFSVRMIIGRAMPLLDDLVRRAGPATAFLAQRFGLDETSTTGATHG